MIEEYGTRILVGKYGSGSDRNEASILDVEKGSDENGN